jgi:hypothetical protein
VSKGRTILLVSVVAVLVLGALGVSLLLLAGGSDDDDDPGNAVVPTVPTGDVISFRDPQGAYTMDIDPEWEQSVTPNQPDVETWFTPTGTDAFRDNVTVLAQTGVNVSLDDYMQLVIDQAPQSVEDFQLREFRVLTPDLDDASDDDDPQRELGVIAYDGTQGTQSFGFLLVASVENGNAVLATFTTEKDRFDAARAEVEPYLLTLRQPTA